MQRHRIEVVVSAALFLACVVFNLLFSPIGEVVDENRVWLPNLLMGSIVVQPMLIALLVGKGTANLSAMAGTGFYCFAAYCLVSNAAFQALKIEPPTPVATTSSATTSSPFSARS